MSNSSILDRDEWELAQMVIENGYFPVVVDGAIVQLCVNEIHLGEAVLMTTRLNVIGAGILCTVYWDCRIPLSGLPDEMRAMLPPVLGSKGNLGNFNRLITEAAGGVMPVEV